MKPSLENHYFVKQLLSLLAVTFFLTLASLGLVLVLFQRANRERSREHDWIASVNRLGLAEYEAGRLESARSCFLSILACQSNDVPALANTSLVLNRLGQSSEALGFADRALALQSNCVQALNNKAISLAGLGRQSDALRCADNAIQVDESYYPAWVTRGNLLQRLGTNDLAQVSACYDRALSIAPQDLAALIGKAWLLLKLDRIDAVDSIYDRLAGASASDPEVSRIGVALALRHQQYSEALHLADGALKQDPANADLWNDKGLVLYRSGRHEEAILALETATRLKPEAYYAWNNLALALHARGQISNALQTLAHSLALNPEYPEAKSNHAWMKPETTR